MTMIEVIGPYATSACFVIAISIYFWRSELRGSLPNRIVIKPPTAHTYRIRGIPKGWTAKDVENRLSQHSCCVVKSLAKETNHNCLTATAIFSGGYIPPEEIILPASDLDSLSRNSLFVVDDDFLGITTLYMPSAVEHKLDIIAISGLGGHAFGSFKQRHGLHMWLRDALPHDLRNTKSGSPMARVMIYGHESQVAGSNSMQNLADLASSFRHTLLSVMRDNKPTIFLAHSLGGLIAKEALIRLAKSSQKADQDFLEKVCGVVFFGVPHHGMDSRSLRSMAGDGPNRFLIESLDQRNSHVLNVQRREFLEAFKEKGISFFCFYETEASPTAQEVNGKWSMSGPREILVSQSSATICRPWEDESHYVCAIGRSHSDIVKFAPRDADYDRVLARLRSLADEATCRPIFEKRDKKTFRTSDSNELPEMMEMILLEAEIKAVEEYRAVLEGQRRRLAYLKQKQRSRLEARKSEMEMLEQRYRQLLDQNDFTDYAYDPDVSDQNDSMECACDRDSLRDETEDELDWGTFDLDGLETREAEQTVLEDCACDAEALENRSGIESNRSEYEYYSLVTNEAEQGAGQDCAYDPSPSDNKSANEFDFGTGELHGLGTFRAVGEAGKNTGLGVREEDFCKELPLELVLHSSIQESDHQLEPKRTEDFLTVKAQSYPSRYKYSSGTVVSNSSPNGAAMPSSLSGNPLERRSKQAPVDVRDSHAQTDKPETPKQDESLENTDSFYMNFDFAPPEGEQYQQRWKTESVEEENVDGAGEEMKSIATLEAERKQLKRELDQLREETEDDAKLPLELRDGVLDRMFNVPWKFGKDWKSMMRLVEQVYVGFPELHMRILENKFEMVDEGGHIILPAAWNTTVKPGGEVNMLMAKEDSVTRSLPETMTLRSTSARTTKRKSIAGEVESFTQKRAKLAPANGDYGHDPN
ncbi:hypothetical protein K461DRAFT_298150 [Myriangium duriaei CBS 260.36]|uniref:Ubiquitin-like domain-containing protein n=1 Tax=Myriangium duriaei CBS 260.36 TaxID=1168546 RepID=A0A9P4IQX6_9PEZI|nr:hypothetical protein K461DRAFT_298150 [Myriangium duriaei CBS 260.36]